MFGILRPSAILKSVGPIRSLFPTVNDCLKLFEGGSSPQAADLYNALRYLTQTHVNSRDALNDSRISDFLNHVDTAIPTLNTSYLGNYALRMKALLQVARMTKNEETKQKALKIIENIAASILEKDAPATDLAKVAYVAAQAGVDNPQLNESAKRKVTLQIDNIPPNVLNMALTLGRQADSDLRVFTSLLVEKLTELTDRFTAEDVVNTIKTLADKRILKGFLLRRLSTLITDNLDQFSKQQLSLSLLGLAECKFLTHACFMDVFSSLRPQLNELNVSQKILVAYAGCFANIDPNNKNMLDLVKSIDSTIHLDSLAAKYIYSCAYYKHYEHTLQETLDKILSKELRLQTRESLLLKEAIDAISNDTDSITVTITNSVENWFDRCEDFKMKLLEGNRMFSDVKKILSDSDLHFEPLQRVGPVLVDLVDHENKRCIMVEVPIIYNDHTLNTRLLGKLGYRCHVVRYWGWRQASSQREELCCVFRLFDRNREGKLSLTQFKQMLQAIGIYLTKQELEFLEYEGHIRGGFSLQDLYAIGEVFYNDTVIKEKVKQSLRSHFPGSTKISKETLERLLITLGAQLRVGRSEVQQFLKFYVGDGREDMDFDRFIELVLSE
ncbi:hypothetical protein BEWA_009300 [Theileria equi strain WA]|uniref:EF-hand domain-containing protein n=1 Tax=Theileria equi strain WA TaxID=1537102 RepID=L0B0Y0_THEEQ|nr:hypothetical protein BEWA_009300 [Theileria equi strain WA]AFZ81517.1 hypothetical protein BEWA_009300 [Theileria equi strain WA]|eukprot:XP_004831183.1 hypothetical protein BEWA_009300 [Theileria equi strain WA]